MPSSFEENLEKAHFKNGAAYAQATAMAKAQDVASRDWPQQSLPSLVIGADTVVEQDGCILEKPADASDAHNMLTRFAMICSRWPRTHILRDYCQESCFTKDAATATKPKQ